MEAILYPLLGGVIIGLASTLMLVSNGKIAGISGIISKVLGKFSLDHLWRYSFVLGLLFGALVTALAFPKMFAYELKFSLVEAIIAGLLVGLGTAIGSGCTSGHGVCGLPRLSLRSFVATMTFIGVGILTVLVRGLL